jgi:hypothetical protein
LKALSTFPPLDRSTRDEKGGCTLAAMARESPTGSSENQPGMLNLMHRFAYRKATLIVLALGLGMGCTNREYTRTPRTSTEQLLLSQALEKSMGAFQLPFGAPATVAVEVAGFVGGRQMLEPGFLPNGPMVNSNTNVGSGTASTEPIPTIMRSQGPDLGMVRGIVEGRLMQLGYTPVDRRDEADLYVRLLVLSMGTDQGQSFLGMPAIQSTIIPFSTPALTLYEAQRQIAYVRYRLQIYESRTGKWHAPAEWYEGLAYYNQYTLLFFFTFRGTDLVQAPYLQ